MVTVDDVGVAVAHGTVTVRMAVRFGSFRAVVIVLMVLIVMGMKVTVVHVAMVVPQLAGIVRRPQAHGGQTGD